MPNPGIKMRTNKEQKSDPIIACQPKGAIDTFTLGLAREVAGSRRAIQDAFGAPKMNYEALGNSVPHLHWWLTPRRPTDARPRAPIWEDLDFLRAAWTKQPTTPDERRQELRIALLDALDRRDLPVTPLVDRR